MGKGQIQQVYIILFALIVIGASVYLGIRLISGLTATACEADNAAFMRDVRDALDANAPLGSRSEVTLAVPCDAAAVCFVDSGALGNPSFTSDDPTIAAAVKAGVKTTIYLRGKESTVPAGYDERIILREPGTRAAAAALCVNITHGEFALHTQGYGRYIQIKP